MRRSIFIVTLILTVSAYCQVFDVNGDKTVGPEEAIAVADQWKGAAITANGHNHLGQTWNGNRNPLIIRGNFPPRIIIGPSKEGAKGISSSRAAPLILDNTSTEGNGIIVESEGVGAHISGDPALVLGGLFPRIETEETGGSIAIHANDTVQIRFDLDGEGGENFQIAGPQGLVGSFRANGDLLLLGEILKSGSKTKIDHPQNPTNQYLTHSSVESSERKNIYDGVANLDDQGEAVVQLPDYFEAYNTDFRYQLTPIGSPAPDLFISEKIKGNRFKIAGGVAHQEISWQITGVRQDAYSQANPVEVEPMKSEKERGKYLHPELFGESKEKSIPFAHRIEGD